MCLNRPCGPGEAGVVLIPVPWEPTTSYGGGTASGPEAIRQASKQVDLFDRETGRPYQSGIAMLDIPKTIVDWNAEAKGIAAPVIEKGGVVDDATRKAASEVAPKVPACATQASCAANTNKGRKRLPPSSTA